MASDMSITSGSTISGITGFITSFPGDTIIYKINQSKWQCVGHIARITYNSWGKRSWVTIMNWMRHCTTTHA